LSYNGWTNYETWNVALWLDNDEGSESYMRDLAEDISDPYKLARAIQEFVEEGNPLSGQASLYSDILSATLREVDWEEVARHYLPEEEREEVDETPRLPHEDA